MGILRRERYLGIVFFRKGWSLVRGGGILRILGSLIDNGGILSKSRRQILSWIYV